MTTYYWDFFGPRAMGIALHFVIHLNEFLRKHDLSGCETGHVLLQAGHVAAWCKAPSECSRTIVDTLRPKRCDPAPTAQADVSGHICG